VADRRKGRDPSLDPRKPEVGVFDIRLTPAGRASSLFDGVPPVFPALQWHGAEVVALPPGAVTLAENEHSPIQALELGRAAYGIQYHIEQTEETVGEWGRIPEYRCALEKILGTAGQDLLEQATSRHRAAFREIAGTVYRNFRRLSATD
jgi:GMP synthase-like glutamine amidotransferase